MLELVNEETTVISRAAGPAWRGYSLDTTRGDVVALFRARYGRDPDVIRVAPGVILAGPVPGSRNEEEGQHGR